MGSINERFIGQAWEKMTAAVGPGDTSAGDAGHSPNWVNKLGSAPRCKSKHDKSFRKHNL